MTGCDWRDCQREATIALRFGDGYWIYQPRQEFPARGKPARKGVGAVHRQSYCHYCDDHAALVDRWFITCDVRPAGEVERRGPYGRKAEAHQADR